MGYNITREAWKIIEIKIRRYPENKAEYEEVVDSIMNHKQGSDGQPKGTDIGNPTERLAIKLAEEPRLQRLKREVEAVEAVYNSLKPEHQKVIRVRFWSYRYQNMRYFDMERATSYSDIQMRRIVKNFIRNVGERLGEI
ncbi:MULTISPECIES: hypothetical protein [Hungatella]|uniref:Uncharacterized protein n=1 Tax=Hungatella hathewayi TaxID=154046 RepID=A0AA37N672_9FIRM|nr:MULTISPECIES: hypothetical protein [Hungatella]MCI6454672.1 hypothetical protein [Hungatella sp.]GKG99095.1 hypothetical protein CE91St55_10770 [Hungatella hathewayi]GKH05919.1 hypothetical protein CE91St54_10270 [Hungatella hathewayi]